MSFLNLTVWQALVLLAVSAAAIVGLYFLKPPPRRLVVSTTMLWRRVLEERKSRSDRWRWWLSLLVALAIGLSIALAVGRPEIRAVSGEQRRIAVVLDNTPTMAAFTSDGRTRWDHAVEIAQEILRQGSPGSEFLIADTTGQIVTAYFEDRGRAREALQTLHLSVSQHGQWPFFDRDGAELYFISDGVLIDPAEVPPDARLLSIFEPTDNVGITAFVVRPQPANPDRFEAFLEIANASESSKTVSIQLSGPGQRRLTRSVELDNGQTLGEIFDLSNFDAGAVRATVSAPGDSLDADNVAFSYLPARRVIRAVLVTSNNLYLETLLHLDPKIRYTLFQPEGPGRLPAADVYVFDRYAPPEPPVRPSLLVNPPDVPWLDTQAGEIDAPGAIEWDREHPLLQSVFHRDLMIERSTPIGSGDGRSLVESPGGPLIVAAETPVKYVHVGFSLEESNFALQPGFPIFFANVMSWLTGTPQAISRSVGTVEVPLPDASITSLEGTSVPVATAGGVTFFETREPGLYTAAAQNKERLHVVVNLTDRAVTELNHSGFEDPGPQGRFLSSTGNSAEEQGESELWLFLLSFAGILILLEWWSYHRRMTI